VSKLPKPISNYVDRFRQQFEALSLSLASSEDYEDLIAPVHWSKDDRKYETDYPNWREQGGNKIKYRRGLKKAETESEEYIHPSELGTIETFGHKRTESIRHIFGSKI